MSILRCFSVVRCCFYVESVLFCFYCLILKVSLEGERFVAEASVVGYEEGVESLLSLVSGEERMNDGDTYVTNRSNNHFTVGHIKGSEREGRGDRLIMIVVAEAQPLGNELLLQIIASAHIELVCYSASGERLVSHTLTAQEYRARYLIYVPAAVTSFTAKAVLREQAEV
jgi:transcriptional antiterminator Rof (Rho-off)